MLLLRDVLARSVFEKYQTDFDLFNRALDVNAPSMMWNPDMPFGLSALDRLIARAALQIAYSNDFLFLFYTSIPALLLVWLMKKPELPGAPVKPEDRLRHAD